MVRMSVGLVLAAMLVFIYWFYFSKPTPFLTNEQVVARINNEFSDADVTLIQDTIFLDHSHVFVPFISNGENHGISLWVWQKHKWTLRYTSITGAPRIWKINTRDPSTYYMMWNMHPSDQLNSLHFYLMRERNYLISDDRAYYDPKIQMKNIINLDDQPYGVAQFPTEWVELAASSMKIEKRERNDFLSMYFYPEPYIMFGWIPYDQGGREVFPEHSVNGQSFSDGGIEIEPMMILDEANIEFLDAK